MKKETKTFRARMAICGVVGLWVVLTNIGSAQTPGLELYVTDALTIPNQAVQLQARLIKQSSNGEESLPEKVLEFFVQGRAIGQATTDAEGWARLDYTPKIRGNLSIVVKVVSHAKLEAIESKGVLLSWERRRPILLIDLNVMVEGKLTVEPPHSKNFVSGGFDFKQPHPAAAAELKKLSQFYYNLVYLDLTGQGHLESIQMWLRNHQFPPGAIRILPQSSTALADLLRDLKDEGWKNVDGGIGRTAEFAEVLVQNRLQTIILANPETRSDFPRRAIVLQDWSRVRRHL